MNFFNCSSLLQIFYFSSDIHIILVLVQFGGNRGNGTAAGVDRDVNDHLI